MLIRLLRPRIASVAAVHGSASIASTSSQPSSSSSSSARRAAWPARTSSPRSKRKFAHQAGSQPTTNAFNVVEGATSSDVVIVGGGVVGLALACSLAASPTFRSSKASITLVEASSMEALRTWSKRKQNDRTIDDWENRAIYLTEENRAWLDSMAIDELLLKHRCGPVHSMHVTDGLTGAALDFDASRGNNSSLGTMVEISNLQQALLRRLEMIAKQTEVDVRILDGRKVEAIDAVEPMTQSTATTVSYVDAWPLVRLDDSTSIKARLLIGADGHNSPVRKYAGIKAHGWPYDRMGVVATVKVREPQEQERVAFQRFLPSGTIAWLPLSHDSASIVWTLPPDMAKGVIRAQKEYEVQSDDDTVSPVGLLISAAFRLPWSNLRALLKRLASEAETNTTNGAWIRSTIEQELATQDIINDGIPAPVSAVLQRSVAGFPLKLSHAESYLGSSLRQTTFAEAGAGAILPSTILQNVIRGVSAFSASPSHNEVETSFVHGRTALIGDAAHTIHPLAGQGLNLGIADARSLAQAVLRATGDGADLGSHLSLQEYPSQRYLANQAMLSAVDHLHWLFVTAPPGTPSNSVVGDLLSRALVWSRSTGFEVLNELDIVKKAIVGAAGSRSSKSKSTLRV